MTVDQSGAMRELTFEEAAALGLDPTGRDGDPRFPYRLEHVFALFGGRSVRVAYCATCQEPTDFKPYHFPSRRCESGMHNHCSCGTCF